MKQILSKYANTIENLIVAGIVIIGINFIVISPMRKEMREQFKIVSEIASQPKYAIQNDFEKMRTKKSGSITLDLNNDLTAMELNNPDTSVVKKGLFKRIFKKNK